MTAATCATRCVPPPRAHCAPQTHHYADGLRAALAICDHVASDYDDVRQVDDVRWYLRRALAECDACVPAPDGVADETAPAG